MNYAPDYGNLLWIPGVFVLSGGILYGTLLVDEELRACSLKKLWRKWFISCVVAVVGCLGVMREAEPIWKLCLFILAVYLVVCSVMDSMLCMVSDFMQYVGVVGGGIWVISRQPEGVIGVSLLLFGFMQYGLFRKMYGGADVMGFLICALYWAGRGGDIEDYLCHMLLCYLLLAVMQGIKSNISKKGNLKKPVPLFPYISMSFLIANYLPII